VTEPVRPDDDLLGGDGRDGVGLRLWQATLAWQRAVRSALDPHELTYAQYVLLSIADALAAVGVEPTPPEIGDRAGIDHQTTGQVLRRLAARQLVVREYAEGDATARVVRLTEEGEALLADAAADVEKLDVTFFSALGDDSPAFVRGLDAIRD
jgi:DNA-binding MarR family transcriptional regulator